MHSCVSEAKIRKGWGGAQEGRDVQIHFSITQLTAPWENKSKKCATLKCVHAARDISNVNPVLGFSKSLIIWLCWGRGICWSFWTNSKVWFWCFLLQKGRVGCPCCTPFQGTAAPTLCAYWAIFCTQCSVTHPLPTKVFNNFLWKATHYTKAELNKKYSRERTDC